jgi:hypothetical protein
MKILDKIELYLDEKKSDFKKENLKVEKNNKEFILSYDGNMMYIPLKEFSIIRITSKDGKLDTTSSIALANKKLTKFFTKDGIEYLKSEFKKIDDLTGINVYNYFKGK